MKNFKKNQVIIFVIALMLVTAGYLNYTTNPNNGNLMPTSSLADSEQVADIGDAKLVSANTVNSVSNLENGNSISNNSKQTSTETMNNNQNVENNNSKITSAKVDNSEMSNTNYITTNNNEVGNNNSTNSTSNNNSNYFAQSKLDRDSMYSQMLDTYNNMLENESTSASQKSIAQTEIKRINDEKNAIMIAENLIKTKGFEDVVIFLNNGISSIIIRAEKLDEKQISQIQNIVTRELKIEVNKINISNKK